MTSVRPAASVTVLPALSCAPPVADQNTVTPGSPTPPSVASTTSGAGRAVACAPLCPSPLTTARSRSSTALTVNTWASSGESLRLARTVTVPGNGPTSTNACARPLASLTALAPLIVPLPPSTCHCTATPGCATPLSIARTTSGAAVVVSTGVVCRSPDTLSRAAMLMVSVNGRLALA